MEFQYLFILGIASELAEEELSSVLPDREITPETLRLLGGTVKVAEIFSVPIADKLTEGKSLDERIVFGLSGDANIHDCKEVKDSLENLGFKTRFVLPKIGENELSSVVITKQKVNEIYLLPNLTAKTLWVQDFEDWGKRDYDRPEAQGHIGMLPPKVARMMVNIGIGGRLPGSREITILDPFCGVGTILAEGLMVGASVIGSDNNSRQVQRTKDNLDWLAGEYQVSRAKYQVSQMEARNISSKISAQSIDAIVTEPDLGPNKMISYELRMKNYGHLEKMYLDSFADWKNILKPPGRVVMVVPSFGENPALVKTLVDKAKVMGYSLVSGPFPYFRPQAQVRRNICVFELATSH